MNDQLFSPLLAYVAMFNTLGSYERQFGAATFTVKSRARIKGHADLAVEDVFTGDNPTLGAATAVAGPLTMLLSNDIEPITLEGLDIELGPNEEFDYYYGLIDFEFFARKYVGEDIVEWMKANVHPLDIVFRLAEDHGIVLLNGSGFAAPDWSVRISFANLDDHVYDDIGRALRAIARGYRRAYEAAMAQGTPAAASREAVVEKG